jgi:hypothetical protein
MRPTLLIGMVFAIAATQVGSIAAASNENSLGYNYPTLGSVEVSDAPTTDAEATSATSQKSIATRDAEAVFKYNPAPPSAAFDLRKASWSQLRIMDVDNDGQALRNGLWLSSDQVDHYYGAADDTESQRLEWRGIFRNVRNKYGQYVVPPSMAVLLAIAGGGIGNAQYGGTDNYSQTTIYQKTAQDAAVGAAIGLVVGEALVLLRNYYAERQSIRDFRQAADIFNQQLLQDLRLRVLPSQGGGNVGIDKTF